MDRYDYGLPESAVAQTPVEPRSAARLLDALDPGGALAHRSVADLPTLLGPGDLLVVNETRVIPARIFLEKEGGARVELLLLEPVVGDPPGRVAGNPGQAGGSGDEVQVWQALVRPLKRCPPGTRLLRPGSAEQVAVVGERCGDGSRARVTFSGKVRPRELGILALPPYIRSELADPERYQTVYGTRDGSVAAPTAGLHFTPDLLERCRTVGASIATVDLAVGLATFKPITAARPEDHRMHAERYSVPAATLEACKSATRVVAVGTTTVRALEAAAATGELSGQTSLYIRSGYPFRVVDVLMTNFHLPRSSLLLLVEAFCGERWRDIYRVALDTGYRFLSFGDAMIVGRS